MSFDQFKAALVRLCPANERRFALGKLTLEEIAYNTAVHCFVNGAPDSDDTATLRVQLTSIDATGQWRLSKK